MDFGFRMRLLTALARGNANRSVPVKLEILQLLSRYGCLNLVELRKKLQEEGCKVSLGGLHNYIRDLMQQDDWDGLLATETAGRKTFIYVKDESLLDWLFSETEPPQIDYEVTREILYYLNVTKSSLNAIHVRSLRGNFSLLEYAPILLMKLSALGISPVTAVKLVNRLVRAVGSDTTIHELDQLLEIELRKIDSGLSQRFQRMMADQNQLRSFESIMRTYSHKGTLRGLWGPSVVKLKTIAKTGSQG